MARMQDCAWQATTQQSQGSVERINKGIKKVLGSLMRKNKDQYWVKYLNNTQYAINTSSGVTMGGLGGALPPILQCLLPPSLENDIFHEANSNDNKILLPPPFGSVAPPKFKVCYATEHQATFYTRIQNTV